MVGKDQFCNYCMNYMTQKGIRGGIISTIDIVKKIAVMLGWDELKTPEDRKFLSDLKKLLTDWKDVPFTYTKNSINETYRHFINQLKTPPDRVLFFVHCREPEEIERFKKELGAITVIIRREEYEQMNQSNSSDENVLNYEYDYEIWNNKELDDLQLEAIKFVDKMVKF